MPGEADSQAHFELVERVVHRLQRELDLSCDIGDLRAWGHQGLLEAKQRFDPNRGVRFSTFAYYRVRGAVIDGVRKQGWLRRRAYAKLKAYEAGDDVAEQLADGEAQVPSSTLRERAQKLEDALGKISAAYMMSAVGQGEEDTPDTPEELMTSAQTRATVTQSLSALPERERVLLEAVYFEGSTIEEAGQRLGLSKSWASRMHAKALERLRKGLAVALE
jgi:RNA polymerase sigma factor FliA